MCDMLFTVDVSLIPFSMFSESKKITKFCSESIFSIISSVSPIDSASAMNVDAILALLYFQLIPSFILWRTAKKPEYLNQNGGPLLYNGYASRSGFIGNAYKSTQQPTGING
jgi:hypothetical protein